MAVPTRMPAAMRCPNCGMALSPGFRICPSCGTRVTGVVQPTAQPVQPSLPSASPASGGGAIASAVVPAPPAGFWRRAGALLIDSMILVPLSVATQQFLVPHFGGLLVWWLYYALLESSRSQATLGKRVLRLRVTDVNGVHIRFGVASKRFFAKFASAAIFGIGFLVAARTAHKQALHDLIANTLVVRRP